MLAGSSEVGDLLQRERRLRERFDGYAYQEKRAVVSGRPIEVHDTAIATSVDEHPFAIAAYTDGDGFHGGAAVGVAVARCVVEMTTPEA